MENKEFIIRTRLNHDVKFLIRCILKLHKQQEADEQLIGETVHDNGVGFNKGDSAMLSAVAKSILRKATELKRPADQVPFDGVLLEEVRHKMQKYVGQLVKLRVSYNT